MKIGSIKYDILIVRILIIAGLGCSILYSTQLFDGIKTTKTFYFIMVVCLGLLFLSGRALQIKKSFTVSLSLPDLLLALYTVWAVVRLLTSNTDSIYNLYIWEFTACVLWYFCLRYFFSYFGKNKNIFMFFLIALGYVQLMVCLLQLTGMITSFSSFFPVSGTFENISKLCIYLTCILPVATNKGLQASDSTLTGKLVRTVCLLYVLCWLALVLSLGSRTSLLSGLIGMVVFTGLKTGFFEYFKRKTNLFIHKTLFLSALLLIICGLIFLLAQYKQDSARGRLLIWKVALLGIKETPLQGQGFNAFQAKYGHYQAVYFQQHADNQNEIMIADNINAAFNDYVEIAFNLGFVGLFLFGSFWLSLLSVFNHKGHKESAKLNFSKAPSCDPFGNSKFIFLAITVLVIFLVSSGFYFVEKMLPVKTVALFFAAYAGSHCKTIAVFQIRPLLMKAIAATILIFGCFAGYATVNRTAHYAQWGKAEAFSKFGYTEEAAKTYESVVKHMHHNGLFLFLYAKNLYEIKAYQRCLEFMEMAKPLISNSDFYSLLGDAYCKTSDYDNAISYYQYAAYMVPNRFRPLYKLFKLYEEAGNIQQAFVMAHTIVNKPVKVESNEVREIKNESINFIQLNKQNE